MLRVRTQLTGPQGAPWLSTNYFDGIGAPTPAEAAVAAVEAFWTELTSYIANDVIIDVSGDVYVLNNATGAPTGLISVDGAQVLPTSSNGMNPLASQGLVQWRTSDWVNGRNIRGRTFIPGLVDSAGSNGVPSSGFLAAAEAAGEALLSAGADQPVVWSRANQSIHDIVGVTVWSQFAILRSRRD